MIDWLAWLQLICAFVALACAVSLMLENGELRRKIEARNAGLKVIGDINRQLVEENNHHKIRFDGIRERLENLIWLASEDDEPNRDSETPGEPCSAGSGDCSGGSCGRESSGGCEDSGVSG